MQSYRLVFLQYSRGTSDQIFLVVLCGLLVLHAYVKITDGGLVNQQLRARAVGPQCFVN